MYIRVYSKLPVKFIIFNEILKASIVKSIYSVDKCFMSGYKLRIL